MIGDSEIKELSAELKMTMRVEKLTSEHKDAIHRIALSIARERTEEMSKELVNQIMIQSGF